MYPGGVFVYKRGSGPHGVTRGLMAFHTENIWSIGNINSRGANNADVLPLVVCFGQEGNVQSAARVQTSVNDCAPGMSYTVLYCENSSN